VKIPSNFFHLHRFAFITAQFNYIFVFMEHNGNFIDKQMSVECVYTQWRFWSLHLGGGASGVAIIAAGGHGPILPQ